MSKRVLSVLLVIGLACVSYLAAGPWLAIHGLRTAIAQRDRSHLDRYVDFPTLRLHLKQHLQDRLSGSDLTADPSVWQRLMGHIAPALAQTGIDFLVTPAGIETLLQGHDVWNRLRQRTDGDSLTATVTPVTILDHPQYHLESLDQVTAITTNPDGQPVVYVFTRQGWQWRLTDIRLPSS